MKASSPYTAIGVPPPRKTFLDSRRPRGSGAAATTGGDGGGGAVGPAGGGGGGPSAARGSEGMLLGEHKVELSDMLQESVSILKNVYRSKFVFGEHLRAVDPSFSGDTVNQFNLAPPPVFDAAYAHNITPGATAGGGGAGNNTGSGRAAGGGDEAQREKLRTAEELIKKLYRRNTQLEVENTYYKTEIVRFERLSGLSRTPSHNLTVTDGHLPLDHPLYTPEMKRRCRSCPPARTLLRASVNGFGLSFPKRGAADVAVEEEAAAREEPEPVLVLKRRVLSLTESLVALQHENESLRQERGQRMSLRDQLLRSYLCERDTHISQLHSSLQDIASKVNNPMRLVRTKQPSTTLNPTVAANNVLKEVSHKLAENISAITEHIVRKTSSAMPPSASYGGVGDASFADTAAGGGGSPSRPMTGGGAGGSPMRGAAGEQSSAATAVGSRRRELVHRMRSVVETLPVGKRKQLLLLMAELRQLFEALVQSNRALLQSFDEHRARSDGEAVQLKIKVSMLRDQLRSVGVEEDEPLHQQVKPQQNSAGGGRRGDDDP